jgi:LmbE family N-acetylglucosaminyl deacetylase
VTTHDLTGTARDLTGPGTSEERWRSSGLLAALPRLTPPELQPPGRAVVVAPHPDDETLGVGGTLATWAADADLPVTVVAVTDGEGSHPGSPTLRPAELAERRHEERRRALAALGLRDAVVVRAGLPDGDVAGHRGVLADLLDDLLRPGDTLLAPLPGDGHPDHDAVAEVADAVAAHHDVARWHYAVWLWHWAEPDAGGVHDRGVPREGAVAVALPAAALQAKRDAVACFTTQVEPLSADPRDAAILPPEVLARLLRDVEVLWRTG